MIASDTHIGVRVSLPVLKSEASAETILIVDAAETRCNKWWMTLKLRAFPYNVAAWGVLTCSVEMIEEHVAKFGHGSQEQRAAMINLGRAVALLLDNVSATPTSTGGEWLRWTQPLSSAAKEAVLAAHGCVGLISCFSMWHKNLQVVEVLSPTHLRFGTERSPMQRRVRAYQQGCRVASWPSTVDNPVDVSFVDSAEIMPLLSKLWGAVAIEGAMAMKYPDDSELLSHLRDVYEARLRVAFRRNPELSLGAYKLSDFRQFFAALLSICSVHEYLCAAWLNARGRYPFESAVIQKSRSDWIALICELSSLDYDRVSAIISDMTFGSIRAIDIYLQPFVPSVDAQTLFLVPHFVLNSRAEENVLRVCSRLREHHYKKISGVKETEMRGFIQENTPSRYEVFGPLKLPNPTPDIDIAIKDECSRTLLIGELKWLRKGLRPVEYSDKNTELAEGFSQLGLIRVFLEQHPQYLFDRGVIQKHEAISTVTFSVIARDHLDYLAEQDGLWITEFDALLWALNQCPTLPEAVRRLKSYEWLPVEGRDFIAKFERVIIEGITAELEVFHRARSLAVPSESQP